jgi:DNA-binding MarR family transcriptional regulator
MNITSEPSVPAAEFTKADYEALADFRHGLRRFLKFSKSALTRDHLTPEQFQVMLAIKGYPGKDEVSVGELANQLQIRQNSTAELVEVLVKKGLLARNPCVRDRRVVLLHLTPEGESRLAALAMPHRDELVRLAPDLEDSLRRIKGDR